MCAGKARTPTRDGPTAHQHAAAAQRPHRRRAAQARPRVRARPLCAQGNVQGDAPGRARAHGDAHPARRRFARAHQLGPSDGHGLEGQ